MLIKSPAFGNNQPIPREYTADGQNVSPPIEWDQLPQGTQELALLCEDPDAPRPEPFIHWVAYKIPPQLGGLHEDVKAEPKPPNPSEIRQGQNDMGTSGYTGPAPPRGHGVHHYHFRLYALDKPLEIEPEQDVKSLVASMEGHVLDTAELVGTYQRLA